MNCDRCTLPIPPLADHRLAGDAQLPTGGATVRMPIEVHVHPDCCPGGCDQPEEHRP